MRLVEFTTREIRLSESDVAAVLAVQESDFRAINIAEGPTDLQILVCPLFDNTYNKYKNKIANKLERFIEHKKQNPLQPFGSSDYPFRGDGPLSGIGHAHLTSDISVLYNLVGNNPRQLRLYGVFTHDESGTGQPGKPKLQQQLRTRISQQSFTGA